MPKGPESPPHAGRTPRAWNAPVGSRGIDRVNQQLIDTGTYLTGGPIGGTAGISDYGTEIDLTGASTLSPQC